MSRSSFGSSYNCECLYLAVGDLRPKWNPIVMSSTLLPIGFFWPEFSRGDVEDTKAALLGTAQDLMAAVTINGHLR